MPVNIPQFPIFRNTLLKIKHGDCGMVSLLFITLCRLNGIPAKWQSGFMMHPGDVNLHDWAEIYFERNRLGTRRPVIRYSNFCLIRQHPLLLFQRHRCLPFNRERRFLGTTCSRQAIHTKRNCRLSTWRSRMAQRKSLF